MSTNRHTGDKSTPTDADRTDSKYTRRQWGNRYVPYARTEVNNYGHVVWKQSQRQGPKCSRETLPVHRLLAIAEHGTDAVAGQHVHHKNGIPFDNRPENLELLSPSEHSKRHTEPRIDTVDLLADLRAGAEVLGRAPKPADIDRWGQYSISTYYRRISSDWSVVLKKAGIANDGSLDDDFWDNEVNA